MNASSVLRTAWSKRSALAAAWAVVLGALAPACSDDSSDPAAARQVFAACSADCSAIPAPACHTSQCNLDTGQCEIVPIDSGPCDDGLFCTISDHCKAGQCVGDANRCGLDSPTCKTIACNENDRTCSIVDELDGVFCQATDLCASFASCSNGECVAEPKRCFFEEPPACRIAKCNPATGACDAFDPAPDGTPCELDPCTVDAQCKAGKCEGGWPRNCSGWSDECGVGACDVAHEGCYRAPANAGSACATGDACNSGICNDEGSCVLTAKNDGGICNDGLSCTQNDVCSSGKCKGTGSGVLLAESFASNANGWTTDAPWAISSPQAPSTWCQPFSDHTGAGDNGVASSSLWDLDGAAPRDFAWLTSPAVDASASTAVSLSFYQLLEWLAPPWQQAVIEVWNGTTWVRVWEHQGEVYGCVDESTFEQSWKHVELDLTAYKNSMLRVRFGLAVSVARTESGWSIDDLSIASTSCP